MIRRSIVKCVTRKQGNRDEREGKGEIRENPEMGVHCEKDDMDSIRDLWSGGQGRGLR